MISPTFYTKDRLQQVYLEGKLRHYMQKDPIKVITHRNYTVCSGDTLYTLAKEIFGENGEFYWTVIADINYLRKPDELQVGEVIKLPITILQESIIRLPKYAQSSTKPTKV